jgi:hypothetical protein
MAYLGNNLKAAYSAYLLIDSISASFNGTATSFALTVNGVTPVPFPLNEQNVLISVGGVPQKPDPTGAEGFKFSGTNIVFSSAPKTGEAFWGVVLAGADYVNVGVSYPNGSAATPSITFNTAKTTGLYLAGISTLGFATSGILRSTIDSNGNFSVLSAGLATAPAVSIGTGTTYAPGLYSPGTNQLAISTSGTGRLYVDASGKVGIGTSSPQAKLHISDLTASAIELLRLQVNLTSPSGNKSITWADATDVVGRISIDYTSPTAKMRFGSLYNSGYQTSDLMTLDASGNLGLGATSPSSYVQNGGLAVYRNANNSQPHVSFGNTSNLVNSAEVVSINSDTASCLITTTSSTWNNYGILRTASTTIASTNFLAFGSASGFIFGTGTNPYSEVTRIDSSGNVGIGVVPSAWVANSRAIQILAATSLSQTANGYTNLSSNAYESSIDTYKYIGGGFASLYQQLVGQHRWYTAPSGTASNTITFTQAMTLDASGRLSLGATSTTANLQVGGSTAASKVLIYGGAAGSTYPELVLYGASSDNNWTIRGDHGTALSIAKGTFGSYGSALLTILSGGNVGIGTLSPDANLDVVRGSNGTVATFGIEGLTINPRLRIDVSESNNTITFNPNYSGATSPSLVFNTQEIERMRIDSSGRLLVGTTLTADFGSVIQTSQTSGTGAFEAFQYSNSTAYPFITCAKSRGVSVGTNTIVQSGDPLGEVIFRGADGTNYVTAALITAYVDGTPGLNDMPGRLVFSTTADGAASPTERMRIGSNGFLKVSPNGTYFDVTGNHHELYTYGSSPYLLWATHAGTGGTANGITINYSAATPPNNTSNEFLRCFDTNGSVLRASIRSNGGLANYQANNVNLSDINTKKDISPAADTWSCVKEWEIVNYRYKDQPDDSDLNLGVIAQQVAESCPEVITIFQESKEATNKTLAQEKRLGIKEQQMYWMAIKALQEAMERIETLEAKITALEGT